MEMPGASESTGKSAVLRNTKMTPALHRYQNMAKDERDSEMTWGAQRIKLHDMAVRITLATSLKKLVFSGALSLHTIGRCFWTFFFLAHRVCAFIIYEIMCFLTSPVGYLALFIFYLGSQVLESYFKIFLDRLPVAKEASRLTGVFVSGKSQFHRKKEGTITWWFSTHKSKRRTEAQRLGH